VEIKNSGKFRTRLCGNLWIVHSESFIDRAFTAAELGLKNLPEFLISPFTQEFPHP